MKRVAVLRNVYQSEDGAFWVRLNFGGVRTWRKLIAKTQNQAFTEAATKISDAKKLFQEARRAKYGRVETPLDQGSPSLPACLEPLRHNLIEIRMPPTVTSAIYFLMLDDTCVYVGQTIQAPLLRASQHRDKHFNRILILPTPANMLTSAERSYIRELCPRYNVRLVTKTRRQSQNIILTQARACGI